MFFRTVGMCALMTLGVAAAGSDAAAREYSYQIIKVGQASSVVAMNIRGTVIGNVDTGGGRTEAFVWQAGTVTRYKGKGAASLTAYGINDYADFVGSFVDKSGVQHGFSYVGGKYEVIDYPGYSDTAIVGINNTGVVIGNFTGYGFPDKLGGFEFANGIFTALDETVPVAINQNGDIAATALYGQPQQDQPDGVLIKADGRQFSINNGEPSVSAALNEHDAVVGDALPGGSLVYKNRGTDFLGAPTCTKTTEFTGINNAGDIVGACMDGSAPFVYHHGVFENLKTVRGQVLQPIAINNHGQILANTAGGFSVLATPK